jgi:hypothetical protein
MQFVQLAPSAARLRGICAGSVPGALGRASHNPPVVGSSPTRPTCDFKDRPGMAVDRYWRSDLSCRHPSAHVEQLPSGSWRAKAYGEKD